MDYSLFAKAIKEDDRVVIQEFVDVLSKILFKYLSVRLGASYEDSQDSIQNTMLSLIESVRNDKLANADAILSYMFTTARNDYYKRLDKSRETLDEDVDKNIKNQKDQLQNLMDKERLDVLALCMKELKQDQRNFIQVWFENPAIDAAEVAANEGISVNNAWTKKHRIIKALQECVKNKLTL